MTPRDMHESGFQLTKLGLLPNDWSVELFGDIFRDVRQKVVVKKNEYYQEIGIKSHGKGIFHKEPVLGREIGNKSVYKIDYPALIFNIVFAWEQAIAVTSEQEKYMIASHRFPMYKPIKQKVSLEFAKWFLLTKRGKYLLELASPGGAGRNKTLGKNELKKIPVPIPPFSEQLKIANIIATWDCAIAQLIRLIEVKRRRKKSLMQQLLTGKKRLPGFVKPWISNKLAHYFERITRKNDGDCDVVLTISGSNGLVDQLQYFNKRVAATDLSTYYQIIQGEFAFNKSSSNGYPYGAIKQLEKYPVGVVSSLYICFKKRPLVSLNTDFMKYYFDAGLLNHDLYMIASEGARNHGLLNISPRDFFQMKITIPDEEEQAAIARFLQSADQEIAFHEKQLRDMERQKRGLMQQLLTGEVRVKI